MGGCSCVDSVNSQYVGSPSAMNFIGFIYFALLFWETKSWERSYFAL